MCLAREWGLGMQLVSLAWLLSRPAVALAMQYRPGLAGRLSIDQSHPTRHMRK